MHSLTYVIPDGFLVTIVRVSRVDAPLYLFYVHWLIGYYSPGQSGRCIPLSVLCPLAYLLL